jgi:hypothetical protein
MENKLYPGSLPNLFLASDIILDNVRKRLPQFTDHKSYYSETFLDGLRLELRATEGMPDDATRALWHKQARTNVENAAAFSLQLFRGLKRFVYTAFPENTQDYYIAMGLGYYASAANKTWDSVKALCVAANGFIAENLDALTANDNMNPEFQEEFLTASADFNTKLGIFYQKQELAKTGASDRNTACGAIYKKIIGCCLDGQYIFESDDTIKKEYSFEAVSEMVSPPTSSGIIAKAVHEVDGVMVPMPGVEISIVGMDKSGITTIAGTTEFTQLPEASLKIRARADGYEDLLLDFDTEAGVTSRLRIVMIPLFDGPMQVGAEANSPQPAAEAPATATANS